jgi:uncharacterized protein YcfJ
VPDEDESVGSAVSATGAWVGSAVGTAVGADVAAGAGALVAAGSVAFVGTVVLSPPHAKDDTTITNNKLDKIKILFTYPPIKARSILNESLKSCTIHAASESIIVIRLVQLFTKSTSVLNMTLKLLVINYLTYL